MTVKELKLLLSDKPDNIEIFFRLIRYYRRSVQPYGKVEQTTFSTFGIEIPCIVIEPYSNEEGVEIT